MLSSPLKRSVLRRMHNFGLNSSDVIRKIRKMSERPTFTSASHSTDMTHLRVIIIMHVMSLISPRTAVLIKPRNVSSHQTRWWFSSEIKTERVSVSLLFAGDQTLRVRLHQTIYSVDSSTATWETESAGKPVPTSANIWALVLRRRAALASLLAHVLLLLVSREEHSSHFLFKLKHPSYFICENHSNNISDLHERQQADIRKLITGM